MIEVENLTKTYGSKKAIADLSFSVPDGQVTGFLGPNGSGKSTTMRCMLGLDTPSSGSVRFTGAVDGKSYDSDFSKLPNKSRVAGAILDANWFTPKRSGYGHLSVLAASGGIPQSRVAECLDLVGMTAVAKKPMKSYSLGMKQRINFAAALLGDPQHLLLDEPVNGLDPEGVRWLRDTIRFLASQGRAVLVSSHLLNEMQLTADRLVVIGRGQLLGEYSMQEFLAGNAAVIVECPEHVRLTALLQNAGYRVNTSSKAASQIEVEISEEQNEAAARADIAGLALANGLPITQLYTQTVGLEETFLKLTGASQEYSTAQVDGGQN
ncbi:ABC transporter ATP-binding protein [Canibacter zhoujuaniae]|uniref:ABC transporter ATP-binding protein n=1 Tax=Canibacter zhoujuaniae TaxID=2708343 RepID=UPI00141E1C38|nr:ABC transporter ATP-binding protein [Canibacter zhoujuaniae]